jgi:ribosomal protein S17
MGTTEKLQLGTVVSNKMDKTVVVRIDRHKRHRLYGKTIRVTRRYKAHDEITKAASATSSRSRDAAAVARQALARRRGRR